MSGTEQVILENMVDTRRLHGFAKAWYGNLEQSERDSIEILFESIPNIHSEAHLFEMWKASMITVFAEISKDIITGMVQEYRELDGGGVQ